LELSGLHQLSAFGFDLSGPTPIWWTVDVLGSGYSI
jgi:hypothetical protein